MIKKLTLLALLLAAPAYAGLFTKIKKALEDELTIIITNEGYKKNDVAFETTTLQENESITLQIDNQPKEAAITIRKHGKVVIKAKPGTVFLFSMPVESVSQLIKNTVDTKRNGTVETFPVRDTDTTVRKNMSRVWVSLKILYDKAQLVAQRE